MKTEVIVFGVKMSLAAAKNVEECGVDVEADVVAVRGGKPAESLLAECLDSADDDRVSGWRDYVDAIAVAATFYDCTIGDGSSCDGGGRTTIYAADVQTAIAMARDWAREGDYTAIDGRSVSVAVSVFQLGKLLDRRLVLCSASVRS